MLPTGPTPKKHIQSLFTLFLPILRSPVLWNTYDQKLAEPSLKHHKTPKQSGPAMAGLQGSTALLGFNTESSKIQSNLARPAFRLGNAFGAMA